MDKKTQERWSVIKLYQMLCGNSKGDSYPALKRYYNQNKRSDLMFIDFLHNIRLVK